METVSLAYFPLYPTDFDARTGHLTLAEDGAYNRLLRLSWHYPEAKLPDDLNRIYRLMRASSKEDKRIISSVLDEFFTREGGHIFSEKLNKIWKNSNDAHARRVAAGRNGGTAKALKTNNAALSIATELLEQSPSNQNHNQNYKEKEEPKGSSQKKGCRLPGDWVLPREWGVWAISEGMTEAAVRKEADRFADYWRGLPGSRGVKADWLATWRNWIRKAMADEKPKHGGSPTPGETRIRDGKREVFQPFHGWMPEHV